MSLQETLSFPQKRESSVTRASEEKTLSAADRGFCWTAGQARSDDAQESEVLA